MVRTLKRMLMYALRFPGRLIWYMLISFFFGAISGSFVFLIREVTNMLTTQQVPAWMPKYVSPFLHDSLGIDLAPKLRHAYFFLLATALFIAFCKCLLQYMRRYLQAWLTRNVVMDVQREIAEHLLTQDLGYFHQERSGDLLSRFTSDLMMLGRSVKFSGVLITRPITVAWFLVVIFMLNWKLALLGLIGAPLGGIAINTLSRKMRRAAKKALEKKADLTSSMVQFLAGMHIIKAFACEEFEFEQFKKENRKFFDLTMKRERARARIRPIVEFVSVTGTIAALAVGGEWVFNGTTGASDIFAFLAALGMMYSPAKEISQSGNDLQEAIPGAQRVFHILDQHPTIVEGTYELKSFEEGIEFNNVNFQYLPGIPVLRDINLKIRKGQCIALVGPSGAGKSTIADLAPRFYDPSGGTISIDGKDLRQVTFESLRDKISIVSQEPFLFNCSVRDNIAYGSKDATDEKVMDAARAANIHDEIMQMQDGYDFVVGERGGNLSGGQRQRVAIARAIYKDAPILILDEATSSLDSESERKVQEALDRLMQGRTSLVIAHRLSTVMHADQITVIENGCITAKGTHNELLEKSKTYAHLVSLQDTGGKELA